MKINTNKVVYAQVALAKLEKNLITGNTSATRGNICSRWTTLIILQNMLHRLNPVERIIPHSHQNLSCLRSGVDYSQFIGNDTAEELLTPLLRQLLNFWRESGIKHFMMK